MADASGRHAAVSFIPWAGVCVAPSGHRGAWPQGADLPMTNCPEHMPLWPYVAWGQWALWPRGQGVLVQLQPRRGDPDPLSAFQHSLLFLGFLLWRVLSSRGGAVSTRAQRLPSKPSLDHRDGHNGAQ